MKKQQKTYILLTVVILIWSVVIFQFLGYLSSEEEYSTEINYKKFRPKPIQEKEVYKVAVHDRDPFLDTYKTKQKKVARKTPIKAKEVINFPRIHYIGTVKNGRSSSFIISINGSQHIMKLKAMVNDVKLISGNSKEIKLLYKGTYKTITK